MIILIHCRHQNEDEKTHICGHRSPTNDKVCAKRSKNQRPPEKKSGRQLLNIDKKYCVNAFLKK